MRRFRHSHWSTQTITAVPSLARCSWWPGKVKLWNSVFQETHMKLFLKQMYDYDVFIEVFHSFLEISSYKSSFVSQHLETNQREKQTKTNYCLFQYSEVTNKCFQKKSMDASVSFSTCPKCPNAVQDHKVLYHTHLSRNDKMSRSQLLFWPF